MWLAFDLASVNHFDRVFTIVIVLKWKRWDETNWIRLGKARWNEMNEMRKRGGIRKFRLWLTWQVSEGSSYYLQGVWKLKRQGRPLKSDFEYPLFLFNLCLIFCYFSWQITVRHQGRLWTPQTFLIYVWIDSETRDWEKANFEGRKQKKTTKKRKTHICQQEQKYFEA